MRLESMKPTTDRERQIRRKAHAKAILKGMTIREAVFEALDLWTKEPIEKLESSRIQSS